MSFLADRLLFLVFILIHLTHICHSKITGAAIIPHGDFAYDPGLVHNKIGAKRLHKACIEIGEWIMNIMEPDLIFLTTPHGLKLNDNYLIYENDIESGFAMIGDDLQDSKYKSHKISLNISINKHLSQYVISSLSLTGHKVEGLSSFGKHQTLPLKWAEIIPIKYLQNVSPDLPEFIIMSFPKMRHKNYINDLLSIGYDIWNILDEIDLNVIIIISADLSHTHLADIMPYGHCKCSNFYDNSISKWIKTMNDKYLLQNALYYQRKGAKSCGFNGFVLLQGIFYGSLLNENIDWISELQANYHPSYYGMAAANYTRINVIDS